jgi:uncharacterized protein
MTIVQPWYRQFWPWFLIALPGAVVIASFLTLAIAINRSDSVVHDNYYKDGLAINRRLQQDTVAAQRAMQAQLHIDVQHSAVRLALFANAPIAPPRLTLEFVHPFDAGHDVSVALTRGTDGDYRGTLPVPLRGHWYIELRDTDSTQWRLRGNIDLQANQPFVVRT